MLDVHLLKFNVNLSKQLSVYGAHPCDPLPVLIALRLVAI
jgi:hypothetical protein